MANYIEWDGNSSADYGLVIEHYPNRTMPQQKYETEDIPGRNGTVYFYEDAWENYTEEYDVYAGETNDATLHETWRSIAKWLYADNTADPTLEDYIKLTRNGYHQFVDSYDPKIIRLATFDGAAEIENTANQIGRTTLEFNFRPEKFLGDAFEARYMAEEGNSTAQIDYITLTNETSMTAKPLIVFYVDGEGTVTITVSNEEAGESSTIEIDFGGSFMGYCCVDTETQNVFSDELSNLNSYVTLTSEFPKLWPGENEVVITHPDLATNAAYMTNEVETHYIYPRWWSL